jgi:hypothetical protein
MKKGDKFWAGDLLITVTRVSRSDPPDWADIFVSQALPGGGRAEWTKRQPLVNGDFSFNTVKLEDE